MVLLLVHLVLLLLIVVHDVVARCFWYKLGLLRGHRGGIWHHRWHALHLLIVHVCLLGFGSIERVLLLFLSLFLLLDDLLLHSSNLL